MSKDFLKTKIILSQTLIKQLEYENWDDISPEMLILNCNTKILEAHKWLAHDKLELLNIFLKYIDDQIIVKVNNETLNEKDLSILEKIKELVLVKCEFHFSHKSSLKNLSKEFVFKPYIFLSILNSIKYLTNQLLFLFGDNANDCKGFIRKKGVTILFLNIFLKWVSNQDDDLLSIMKVTDDYFNSADEIAQFLNLT